MTMDSIVILIVTETAFRIFGLGPLHLTFILILVVFGYFIPSEHEFDPNYYCNHYGVMKVDCKTLIFLIIAKLLLL